MHAPQVSPALAPAPLDAKLAEQARLERVILGRVAAFGRFAFSTLRPRKPRHAETWRTQGAHESTRACERRCRQVERKLSKDARRWARIAPPVETSTAPSAEIQGVADG